jgi:hypothetical protein
MKDRRGGPRTWEADIAGREKRGVGVCFTPSRSSVIFPWERASGAKFQQDDPTYASASPVFTAGCTRRVRKLTLSINEAAICGISMWFALNGDK